MRNIIKSIKKSIFYLVSRLLPTRIYLKFIYKRIFHRYLDLKNPKTLTEKIQWKKIYDKKEIYTICANKHKVRNYIKEKIGEDYLIPLLYHTNNPDKIDFDKTQLPFIIKTNHGSNQIIVIKNRKDINKKEILKKCKKWLKSNFYFVAREPQYKNIKPKILIEKLLLDKKGQVPKDYKFHCFNGKVEFIGVHSDRFENHKLSFINTTWKLLPFTWCGGKDGKPLFGANKNINKPKNLKKMIKIAEKLSRDFDYVRVDLYSLNNKIYFGELTFHHGAGFLRFSPEKYDLKFGKMLKLKIHFRRKRKLYNLLI